MNGIFGCAIERWPAGDTLFRFETKSGLRVSVRACFLSSACGWWIKTESGTVMAKGLNETCNGAVQEASDWLQERGCHG